MPSDPFQAAQEEEGTVFDPGKEQHPGMILGIAICSLRARDPNDPEGRWAAVKVKPVRPLANPVTLKQVKADPRLEEMELVKLSRLSVAVVRPEEWKIVLELAGE